MPLPKLIFGETHTDPATTRVMVKLIPRLKSLGYHRYFAESPPGYVEGIKGTIEKAIQDWQNEYHCMLKNMHQILNEKNDSVENKMLDQETHSQLSEYENAQSSLNKLLAKSDQANVYGISEALKWIIEQFSISATTYFLLRAILTHDISYQSIDDPIVISFIGQGRVIDPPDNLVDFALNTLSLRNKTMSKAYLSVNEPVFGIVGVKHILGMQKEFINILSQDGYQEKIQCFYIYSKKPVNENFSSNVIMIDSSKKTDEEIIDIIIKRIQQIQSKENEIKSNLIRNSFWTSSSFSSEKLDVLQETRTEKSNHCVLI